MRQYSHWLLLPCLLFVAVAEPAIAEPPVASYIFPAGGQRGTKVDARVGGSYLHEQCFFQISGPGVRGPGEIKRRETIWFEGPIIRQPASQRPEDYPQDFAAEIDIAPGAPLGMRTWRAWNSQGVTVVRPFVVGDLPEIVEHEIDGEPVPTHVTWPVTINGRIFPREDVDIWRFDAPAGKRLTCSVAALEIGSPLEARIELRDPQGKPIAEEVAAGKNDPVLRVTTAIAGTYELRIHDAKFDGLQPFVYRLTISDSPWIDAVYPLGGRRGAELSCELLGQNSHGKLTVPNEKLARPSFFQHRFVINGQATNPVWLAADELPETLETESSDDSQHAPQLALPAVVNGRIQRPGDVDRWTFAAKTGEPISLESQGARLGSSASVMMIVTDAMGKELLRADPLAATNGDAIASFNPPVDGDFRLEIRDRFASRGGPAYGYRVRLIPAAPTVRVEAANDTVAVDRGKSQKLSLSIVRDTGLTAPVTIAVEGLPAGVKAADVVFPPNKPKGDIVFQAEETAPVSLANVRIVARFERGGEKVEMPVRVPANYGAAEANDVTLAVTMPTPFKFTAEFSMTFTPCGAVSRKRYTIDRGGYEGPIEVSMADRQGRHLQGVTGPKFVVPPGQDEFEYPITLAPWMELGRTSRAMPMIVGVVTDEQGRQHKVTYTTNDQACQLVNIVSPAPLRVVIDAPSVSIAPNGSATLPVRIRRDKTVTSPVKLELIAPSHMRDITANPVSLSSSENESSFVLRCGANPGPLNMPLLLRATCEWNGAPLTAETPLEVVLSAAR